jgi:hypothetical protein
MNVKNTASIRCAIFANVAKVVAIALIAFAQPQFVTSAAAQSQLANCSLSAGTSIIICTTTNPLAGVAAPPAAGTLTLSGAGPQPPICSGGLAANPQTGLAPNVATAITLTACLQSADRGTFDYRWVSPAVSGSGVGIGSATATLAAGQFITYSVDVCASPVATALCTRVTTQAITAAGPPVCNTISPPTQIVSLNAPVTALNANCVGATSYQWFLGASPATGTSISGATGATYGPPTTTLGTLTYSVRAINATSFTDSVSSATVTVQPGGNACPAGSPNPRVIVAFTQAAQNFTYQRIEGSALGTPVYGAGTHITQINVGPTTTDSTLNHQYIATWGIVQDDNTTFSNRTISLSQTCGDFSADKIVIDDFLGGNFSLITSDDTRPVSASIKVVTPGIWYVNVRNKDCPAGANCSITGIYTNRNR